MPIEAEDSKESSSSGTSGKAGDVTRMLAAVGAGDRQAYDGLYELVYQELRRIARRQLKREGREHTLLATALVHEAYVKLAGQAAIDWQSRSHFFGVAARAMRQILVDYARSRKAQKRGGEMVHTTLSGNESAQRIPLEEILALDEALNRLGELDPRLRRIVEYRYFAGMSNREIAGLLEVTERTVERDWAKARAWLHKELYSPKGANDV